jgi:putative ABC transport system permease protein
MMIDIVLGELERRRGRTALTVMGVAIGILLVTTLSSFSEGIGSVVNADLSMISGKITVASQGISFESFATSELDESMLDDIKDMPGIDRATAIIAGDVPGLGALFGIRMDDLDLFNLDVEVKEGRFPEEGEDELVLGPKYAEASSLRTGDEVEIRGRKYSVVGVFSETGTEADYSIVTSFEPAQELLKKEGKVTIILAEPLNVEESEVLARDIEATYSDISALSEKDAARRAQEFTSQLSMATFLIGGIAAFIAGIGIMNVMKALGATTTEILTQVVLEAIIITLVGEAIGLVLSFGTVNAVNGAMGGQLTATITPYLIVLVTFFAVGIGVFAGLLPAREASRLQPAVVLRYE